MIWWMLRWLHSFSQTNEWARWLCQYANKINKDVCSHSNWTSLFPIYLLVFCWMHSFHIDRVLTRVYMQVSSILGTRIIFYGSFDLWLINVCRVGWMLVIILHWKMHFFCSTRIVLGHNLFTCFTYSHTDLFFCSNLLCTRVRSRRSSFLGR